jgi:hypothetical protein
MDVGNEKVTYAFSQALCDSCETVSTMEAAPQYTKVQCITDPPREKESQCRCVMSDTYTRVSEIHRLCDTGCCVRQQAVVSHLHVI